MNSRKYTLLQLLITVSTAVPAQTHLEYSLHKYAVAESSLDDALHRSNTDIENTPVYSMRHSGALVDWLLQKTDTGCFASYRRNERQVLTLTFNNRNTTGDYLHYNGRRLTDGSLLAGGHLSLPHAGTLYGMAAYSMRNRKGVYYNYATHPEDYAPYFVGDTIATGTMRQEIYTVKGGYSLSLGKWQWGIDAMYEGMAQAKTTEPRHANYAYWLRLGLSAAKVMGRHVAALRLYPELNRQSISASGLLDAVRYFQFYGFGQWNRRESQGNISYGRTQKITGAGVDLQYHYAGAWNIMARVAYNYRHMYTEESSFKNLFMANSHHLSEQIMASRQFTNTELHLQITAIQDFKTGKENIYENRLQDEVQRLYDYVLVGTNQLYTHHRHEIDAHAKLIYHISPHQAWHLLAACSYFDGCERYKSPDIKIANTTLMPILMAGYRYARDRHQIETDASAAIQMGLGSTYRLDITPDRFTLAQAFIPYELRGENSQQLLARVAYAYELSSKHTVGARLKAHYQNSDYRKVYTLQAGIFFTF